MFENEIYTVRKNDYVVMVIVGFVLMVASVLGHNLLESNSIISVILCIFGGGGVIVFGIGAFSLAFLSKPKE